MAEGSIPIEKVVVVVSSLGKIEKLIEATLSILKSADIPNNASRHLRDGTASPEVMQRLINEVADIADILNSMHLIIANLSRKVTSFEVTSKVILNTCDALSKYIVMVFNYVGAQISGIEEFIEVYENISWEMTRIVREIKQLAQALNGNVH